MTTHKPTRREPRVSEPIPNPRTFHPEIYASRLYARRQVDLRARLAMRPENGRPGLVLHGRTVDLSPTGAGVTLGGELGAGAEVLLELRLPGHEHRLSLRAVVIRRLGSRAGLEFLAPSAEQRLLLGELCRG